MSQQQDYIDVLFPVGRMVGGSLYKPNTTDADGKPLVFKSGANAGQPRPDYHVAVAIPKTPGVTHWAYEKSDNPRIGDWGMKIFQFAARAWPHGQSQRNDFAWKIDDGDSQIPNKRGRKNADREGYPGHWIIRFGGAYAPKIVDATGQQAIDTADFVKPGYYVQPFARITSNNSQQTAGLYINHQAFAFAAYGEEIRGGVDTAAVGFGGAPLPAGASATPLAAMNVPPASVAGLPPPGGAAPAPGLPPPGGAAPAPGLPPPMGAPTMPQPQQPPGLPPPMGAPTMPTPGLPPPMGAPTMPTPGLPPPVQPNPQFAAGAVAPPPVQRTLVVTTPGHTAETLRAAGYTDDAIVSNGWGRWQ